MTLCQFSAAWLVILPLKSTLMALALSYKDGKTKTDKVKNWHGGDRERRRDRKRELEVFLLFPKAETLCPVVLSAAMVCVMVQ